LARFHGQLEILAKIEIVPGAGLCPYLPDDVFMGYGRLHILNLPVT
jgi:hypothetical protein